MTPFGTETDPPQSWCALPHVAGMPDFTDPFASAAKVRDQLRQQAREGGHREELLAYVASALTLLESVEKAAGTPLDTPSGTNREAAAEALRSDAVAGVLRAAWVVATAKIVDVDTRKFEPLQTTDAPDAHGEPRTSQFAEPVLYHLDPKVWLPVEQTGPVATTDPDDPPLGAWAAAVCRMPDDVTGWLLAVTFPGGREVAHSVWGRHSKARLAPLATEIGRPAG